jgi:hypothetical protein
LWHIIKDKFFGHYQINDPKNQPPSTNH